MCRHGSSRGTRLKQSVSLMADPGTRTRVGLTTGCLFQRKVGMPSGVGKVSTVRRASSEHDREADDVRSQCRIAQDTAVKMMPGRSANWG